MKCYITNDKLRFIINFCKKIIKDQKKCILVFQDTQEVEQWNEDIWKYDFIPHSKISEQDIHTKIKLSSENELKQYILQDDEILFYTYTVEEEKIKKSNQTLIILENKNFRYKSSGEYFIFTENKWIKLT